MRVTVLIAGLIPEALQLKIDISKLKTVSVVEGKMGGKPCLGKNRITISKILAEIVDCDSVKMLERDFSLENEEVREFLLELSRAFHDGKKDYDKGVKNEKKANSKTKSKKTYQNS